MNSTADRIRGVARRAASRAGITSRVRRGPHAPYPRSFITAANVIAAARSISANGESAGIADAGTAAITTVAALFATFVSPFAAVTLAVLILSHADVERLLPIPKCIPVMEEALAALARGEVYQPLRQVIRAHYPKVFLD